MAGTQSWSNGGFPLKRTPFIAMVLVTCAFSRAFGAGAATYRVPEQFATIQDAVNGASPGDTIRVGPGTWCGAVVNKRLNVVGDGKPNITNQGCFGPNAVIGFLLPSSGAGRSEEHTSE